MNTIESSILTKLRELDRAVKELRTKSAKPDLISLFTDIDHLTSELPKGSDPELLHFLHKKSYEKALLLLEGKGEENAKGSCR